MAKNDRILADERPLEHFLAILAHFMPRPRNAQEAAHQPEFGHFCHLTTIACNLLA